MPEPSPENAATVERDPYACQVCNCHHHTTEQHGLRDCIGWSTVEEWGD